MHKTTHNCFAKAVLPLMIGLSLITAVALTALYTVRADPGILYAAPTAQGSGDCSNWANACTLQTALTNAQSGDEIWVQAGVHKPTTDPNDREATFTLRNGVAIYGGFVATETLRTQRDWLANPTVLSGDIDGNDSTDPHGVVTAAANITGTNAYHVVTSNGVTETAVLDGFFITAGLADAVEVEENWPHYLGGGMFNYESGPTLTNIAFSGNSASNSGGGVFNDNSGPTLTNVIFSYNQATDGGGMYNYESSPLLTDITFDGNIAANDGGGLYNYHSASPLINVTFSGNTAGNTGGGMYNGFDSSSTLTEVTFNGNTAFHGGGMFNYASNPVLTNVTFSDNSAAGDDYSSGGGMYNYESNPTLTDVTFEGNTATNSGGGMLNYSSSPVITGGSFTGNSASWGGGIFNEDSSPTFTDVTFDSNTASNSGGGMDNLNSSATVTGGSFIGNSAGLGGGVLNEDSSPTFTDVIFDSNTASNYGGGMYNTASSPILTAVTFDENSAGSGGGMYNNNSSSPLLTDVTFDGNMADYDGGGMCNNVSSPTLSDVRFNGNTAGLGGGMENESSSPTLTDVTFNGNTATYDGGGMFSQSGSSPTLRNVIFSGNEAESGGGMYNNVECNPTLTNVIFDSNTAYQSGGGMYTRFYSYPTLSNVIFRGNAAGLVAGGMCNAANSRPTLSNVTFNGNTATYNGGGIGNYTYSVPQLRNVILWGNSASSGSEIYNDDDTWIPVISYSDIRGCGGSGSWNSACGTDGGGNIDADPRFVNPAGGNLRLQLTSPAIDAGINSAVPVSVTTDLDGNPRIVDGDGNGSAIVDMGAYEKGPNHAPGFTSTPLTTATQDVVYTYTVTATDSDLAYGDILTITAPTLPAWLTFTARGGGTATLSGTPSNTDVGQHPVVLRVADSGGLTDTQAFTITVANFNDAPYFASTPVLTATQGTPYAYAVVAGDPDLIHGDALTITAPTKPAWLALVDHGNGTATLSGTPTGADLGQHQVILRVTDRGGLFAEQAFTISVLNRVYLPLVVRNAP